MRQLLPDNFLLRKCRTKTSVRIPIPFKAIDLLNASILNMLICVLLVDPTKLITSLLVSCDDLLTSVASIAAGSCLLRFLCTENHL